MDLTTLHFCDDTPYPPVAVDGKNPQYAAAILSNIGSCNSEMSAVSLYFYNSLVTREFFQEVAECFHRISLVEMHHLDIFGELAQKLGTDPRLWSYNKGRMYYWCPGCNQYPTNLAALLTNAITGEKEAIYKYHAQSEWIQDGHIRAILNRIIADEELHIRIFNTLLAEFASDQTAASASSAPDSSAPASAASEPRNQAMQQPAT